MGFFFYFYNDFFGLRGLEGKINIFLKNIITICIDIWLKLMMSMLYNI